MYNEIISLISTVTGIALEDINENTELVGDMGMTSVEVMDFVLQVEELTGKQIEDETLYKIKTVGDIISCLNCNSN